MKRISTTLLRLASAGVIGLCSSTHAYAFPDSVREQEIFKVDLAGRLPEAELSVVVVMPSCAGVEESLLCRQFREFVPRPKDQFTYAALEGVSRLKSIAGQVQVLPAAARERRYVMLVDWTYSTARGKSTDYFFVNGEVAIYDQHERKVLWHATALQSSYKTEKAFAEAASFYLSYEAILNPLLYGRTLEDNRANGYGIQTAGTAPGTDTGSLVIFNERALSGDRIGSLPASITVEPLAKPGAKNALWARLRKGTYIAASLPPGKYRIKHAHKEEIEVEVAAQQRRAYELSYGVFNLARISELTGEDLAKRAAISRNLLLPDTVARNRYTGALAWADIAPDEQAVAAATAMQAAAAANVVTPTARHQPRRADRPTARIRFLGKLGTKIDFYENRMCYRGSAKGTDVSGADGADWAWLKGKNESFSVGIPDTELTLAIKAKAKRREYFREFEIPAGKPVSVGMSDSYTYGPNNSGKVSCKSGRSFIPVAGADYEARFDWGNGGCIANIREISVEQDQVHHLPVELARVPEC